MKKLVDIFEMGSPNSDLISFRTKILKMLTMIIAPPPYYKP